MRRSLLLDVRARYLALLGLPMVACGGSEQNGVPPGLVVAPVLASNATGPKTLGDGGTLDAGSSTGIARRPIPPEPKAPTGMVNCIRQVTCRQEEEELPIVPFPQPFEKCLPTSGKTDAAFSRQETETRRGWDPRACCYIEYSGCSKQNVRVVPGRPLRDECGALVVARCIDRSDWLAAIDRAEPEPEKARAWLDAAAIEHASVAAFSRVSLELLAAGAPADLIRDVHLAALDEIEHARLSFGLAARFGGAASGPAPLAIPPIGATSLDAILRSALLDGFANEAAAAAEAQARAESETDPFVRDVLERIAVDEERHAALGMRIAMWAIEAGARGLEDVVADLERGASDDVTHVLVLPCVRALLPWRESLHEGVRAPEA